MKCLECGHDLIEMRRELINYNARSETDKPWTIYDYSKTAYAGHCKNCLCDWEWEETFEFGDFLVTNPQRIFWG